jgi:hypothetical protein
MPTVIASLNPGRTVHSYDLLDEIQESTGLNRAEAHATIHAFLSQIADIDGEEAVILAQEPMRPELLENNHNDLDVYHWITISDDAADSIREACATITPDDDETDEDE